MQLFWARTQGEDETWCLALFELILAFVSFCTTYHGMLNLNFHDLGSARWPKLPPEHITSEVVPNRIKACV